ncbi:MAG: FadR family transcriptional regulator [Tagaea sp.]|nr:FadR family transcriptional regulator [Tagaea sp.]
MIGSTEIQAGEGRKRLADTVYEQLRRVIARGEYPKGVKLPPENELATRFGVSRPVVREALARLRDEGVVRSQKGSGTIVAVGPTAGVLPLPPIQSAADLIRFYEFRMNVEGATTALAAERRTLADIETIEKALASADELMAAGHFALQADANFAFHRAIALATQNPYYTRTLESLPNFVGRNMLDNGRTAAGGLAQRSARIHAEHRAIFAAIVSGDPQRARVEMERHILAARDEVLEGQQLTWTPQLRRAGD